MTDVETVRVLKAAQPVLAKKIMCNIEDDALVLMLLKPSLKGEGCDFSKGGYSYKFNINKDPVFQVHAVRERGAVFTPTSSGTLYQAEVGPATLAIVGKLNQMELHRMSGGSTGMTKEQRILDLVKPDRPLLGKEIDQHLLHGTLLDRKVAAASDTYKDIVCLNPEYTSGIATGMTNGIMDLNAPASQTKTRHSLASNFGLRWFTGYGQIPSFAGGVGPQVHRNVISDSHRYAPNGMADLVCIQDQASYRMFENYVETRVQYVKISDVMSDTMPAAPKVKARYQSFVYKGVPYYLSYNIDCSQFTDTTLKKGITYGLDRSTWNGNLPTADDILKALGEWKDDMTFGPQKSASLSCAGLLHFGLWCESLPSNFVIAGGGR